MGETATNTANINMRQALRLRVEEGCEVVDACLSSVCPLHSRCTDTWASHSCVCQTGNTPVPSRVPYSPQPPFPEKHRYEVNMTNIVVSRVER